MKKLKKQIYYWSEEKEYFLEDIASIILVI